VNNVHDIYMWRRVVFIEVLIVYKCMLLTLYLPVNLNHTIQSHNSLISRYIVTGQFVKFSA